MFAPNDFISQKIKIVSKGDGLFIVIESNVSTISAGSTVPASVITEAMSSGILIETMKDAPNESGHHGLLHG